MEVQITEFGERRLHCLYRANFCKYVQYGNH